MLSVMLGVADHISPMSAKELVVESLRIEERDLMNCLTVGIKASSPYRLERVILRALLSSFTSARRKHHLFKSVEPDESQEGDLKDGITDTVGPASYVACSSNESATGKDALGRILLRSFRKRCASSKLDWNKILASGSVVKKQYGRKMRKDEDIEIALKFILSAENVQYLSWGRKRIVMPNRKRRDIPGLTR